jgi:hypothetical protein
MGCLLCFSWLNYVLCNCPVRRVIARVFAFSALCKGMTAFADGWWSGLGKGGVAIWLRREPVVRVGPCGGCLWLSAWDVSHYNR